MEVVEHDDDVSVSLSMTGEAMPVMKLAYTAAEIRREVDLILMVCGLIQGPPGRWTERARYWYWPGWQFIFIFHLLLSLSVYIIFFLTTPLP